MTDRIVPELSASRPYYDDYDDDKRFLRMLFRPGYSVQARELTQLQTILQKQVDRFGSHIFKNGSIVYGGETFFDKKVFYVQVEDTYNGATIDPTIFDNQKIVDIKDSSATGTVIAVARKTTNGVEPGTLIVQLSGSNAFIAGRTIQIPGTANYLKIKKTGSGSATKAVGQSSIVRINEGVFFIDGFFVKNLAQTIILDQYGSSPSYRVGFEIGKNVITETSDTSLLDPALESSNAQAPGAARFQIDLVLSKRDLDSEDDSEFIELLRVESGMMLSQVRYPDYAKLEETLARRTYDESGDYTVRPFRLVLREDQGTLITGRSTTTINSAIVTGSNTFYTMETAAGNSIVIDNELYTISTVTDNVTISLSGPATKNANNYVAKVIKDERYTLQLDPGKAYIKGYEFETIAPTKISTNKARDQAVVGNYEISLNYGNYFTGNTSNGFLDTTTNPVVDLHNAWTSNVSTGGGYTTTKIGTARVMSMDSTGTSGLYRVHLYDLRMTGNNSFSNVCSFSSNSTKQATLDVSIFSKVGSNSAAASYLADTTFSSLIYKFPHQSLVPSSIDSPSYPTKYAFTAQSFSHSGGTGTSGTLTLPTGHNYFGTGTLDSFSTTLDYIVVVTDRLSSNLTTGQVLSYANNALRVAVSTPTTATISAAANSAFVGSIIAVVNFTTTNPKTKTLVTANTSVLSNTGGYTVGTTRVFPNTGQVSLGSSTIANSTTWYSLYTADVNTASLRIFHQVTTFSDFANTSKNITSRFVLDNGQRDAYYDHARIQLKTGATAPTGNVVAVFNYHTHQGSGYFTLDSYPNANTSNGYVSIPSFTSPTTGAVYSLRDCLDFRPRRIDANTATSSAQLTAAAFDIENAKLHASETDFSVDAYSYYLSRIDKVIITRDKIFSVVSGIPAEDPLPPPDDPDGMTIYTLRLPAYTFRVSNIEVDFIENKRFTMRDIGNLEKRIQSLEYYNSLNLLEKTASDMLITDDEGNPRSKYGILVDSFTGYQIADVGAGDLLCSMDNQSGTMLPSIKSKNIKLSVSSNDAVEKNDIIMLPYTSTPFLTQAIATTYEPVAAYAFSDWLGEIEIYPETDYWHDTDQKPDVVVNLNGKNDNWEAFGTLLNELGDALPEGQNPFDTVWGSWKSVWTGSTATSSTFDRSTVAAGGTTTDTIKRTVTTTTTNQKRSGVSSVISPETITRSFGDKVVDVSIIPYIRPQPIMYVAKNMRPQRPIVAYFDDTDITDYCQRLNCITLSTNTDGFKDDMKYGETITATGGYSAKVVLSTGKVLYVTNETGTRPNTGTVTGSTTGSYGTAIDYSHRSGNTVSSTANTIVLESHASSNNSNFVGNPYIMIVAGTGKGQRRYISSYVGSTKTVTVSRNWATNPDTTSIYSLGMQITTPTGQMAGIFHLPKTPIKFHTGERQLKLLDSVDGAGELSTSTTSADVTFYAQGITQSKQEDIISIRVPKVTRTSASSTRVVNNVTSADLTIKSVFKANVADPKPKDPVVDDPDDPIKNPVIDTTPPQDNVISIVYYGATGEGDTAMSGWVATNAAGDVYSSYADGTPIPNNTSEMYG